MGVCFSLFFHAAEMEIRYAVDEESLPVAACMLIKCRGFLDLAAQLWLLTAASGLALGGSTANPLGDTSGPAGYPQLKAFKLRSQMQAIAR
jgi:hypothetical protein